MTKSKIEEISKIFDYKNRPRDCIVIRSTSKYDRCWRRNFIPTGSSIVNKVLDESYAGLTSLYKKYGKPSRPDDVVGFRREGIRIDPIYKSDKKDISEEKIELTNLYQDFMTWINVWDKWNSEKRRGADAVISGTQLREKQIIHLFADSHISGPESSVNITHEIKDMDIDKFFPGQLFVTIEGIYCIINTIYPYERTTEDYMYNAFGVAIGAAAVGATAGVALGITGFLSAVVYSGIMTKVIEGCNEGKEGNLLAVKIFSFFDENIKSTTIPLLKYLIEIFRTFWSKISITEKQIKEKQRRELSRWGRSVLSEIRGTGIDQEIQDVIADATSEKLAYDHKRKVELEEKITDDQKKKS